jgi:hypothetical protein
MIGEVSSMPSPFPGMDPYLEARWLWPDVHNSLVGVIRDSLVPQVAPAYYVAIEERTYIAPVEPAPPRRPDIALVATRSREAAGGVATLAGVVPTTVTLPLYETIRETYLEVREVGTHAVVTVIELLSPTNKVGSGRGEYAEKRAQVLQTATSLVEIDLVREGEPMEMDPRPEDLYRILVSPSWERRLARLWAFRLWSLLPDVPVPLREREKEAVIPLGKLLAELYDRARYDLRLDYRLSPPDPALPPADADWVEALLQEKGLRPSAVDAKEPGAAKDPPSAKDETQG